MTLSMKNLFKMLLNGKQLLSIILNTHKSIPWGNMLLLLKIKMRCAWTRNFHSIAAPAMLTKTQYYIYMD